MTERLSPPNWWQSLVGSLDIKDDDLKKNLLDLEVKRLANGDLAVTTPDGQQYAGRFTTLSFAPAIVFKKTNETNEPALHYFTLPGLPHEQITRGKLQNKHKWSTADEEE